MPRPGSRTITPLKLLSATIISASPAGRPNVERNGQAIARGTWRGGGATATRSRADRTLRVDMDVAGWRARAKIALLGVCIAYAAVAIGQNDRQYVDSDWTAFATGASLATGPSPELLYARPAQQRAQDAITGGGSFDLYGQGGLLPFVSPPWVALLMIPFDAAGFVWGGRLLVLVSLVALLAGVALAAPVDRWAPAFVASSFATLVLLLNVQLDGFVVLGLGAAIAAERSGRPAAGGLALGLTLVKPHLVIPVAVGLLLARRDAGGCWAGGASPRCSSSRSPARARRPGCGRGSRRRAPRSGATGASSVRGPGPGSSARGGHVRSSPGRPPSPRWCRCSRCRCAAAASRGPR
jgi:hypothetical protein